MTLTKIEIAEAIRAEFGVSRPQASSIAETILSVTKSVLASDEDVLVSGFGKLQVNRKAARKGRNLATGETMMLKPRTVVTFKPSGKLRDRFNSE